MRSGRVELVKYLMNFILFFLLSIIPTTNILADVQRSMLDCSKIENDEERLKCYDEIAGRESDKTASLVDQVDDTSEDHPGNGSYLSKLWDAGKRSTTRKYTIMMHRSNYILPVAYSNSPNKHPIQEAFPGRDVQPVRGFYCLTINTDNRIIASKQGVILSLENRCLDTGTEKQTDCHYEYNWPAHRAVNPTL